MKLRFTAKNKTARRNFGFSLVELLMSLGISSISIGSIISGYLLVMRQAEYTACSNSAQALVNNQIEQVRAAKWDPQAYPVIDELVSENFPEINCSLEDASNCTNKINAVVRTKIQTTTNGVPMKIITVECVWNFMNRGAYTNNFVTIRSPEQ